MPRSSRPMRASMVADEHAEGSAVKRRAVRTKRAAADGAGVLMALWTSLAGRPVDSKGPYLCFDLLMMMSILDFVRPFPEIGFHTRNSY